MLEEEVAALQISETQYAPDKDAVLLQRIITPRRGNYSSEVSEVYPHSAPAELTYSDLGMRLPRRTFSLFTTS